ncbi:MAG: endonuclease/exonuclease/phosphatase family metal-dependent hydrolase [Parasphingorhabdus sp.]
MNISVCTYNCKNYFLSSDVGYEKSENEKRAIASVITNINADIVCLQEVASLSVLEDINQRLDSPYQYWQLEEGNSNRGINIGMMSRLAFKGLSHKQSVLEHLDKSILYEYKDKESYQGKQLSPAGFLRDLYLGTFDINGKRLLIFNTHFKSRKNYSWFNHRADKLRLAEAFLTRKILGEFVDSPDHLVLLAGDLNQRYTHSSLRPLCGWQSLYDPVRREIIPVRKNATTYHAKKKERIDYIFLCKNLRHYYIEDSATIHDSLLARIASDHLPVSVDLDFGND